MLIERVKVSEISPAAYNPRSDLQPGDAEYEALKRSIEEFGFIEPIVINKRTGRIISGHQRVKILIAQGVLEIEAVIVDFSIEKEKAANLALNKIRGDWDKEKLAVLLDDLSKLPDFDIGLTGFDLPEISQILDKYTDGKEDDFDVDATVEQIKIPITKKGDLIQLGPHRILCGDSSNPEDIKILMGDEQADLVDCDFPYNVNYCGGSKPNPDTRPKKSRKWTQIYSDNMPQDEYEVWMRKVSTNIKNFLKPGGAIYVWQGHRQFPPMYQIMLDLDFHVSCVICWLKESAAITYADYCFRTEQCLYGWLKGAPHYWAGKPGENNVWEINRDPTKSYVHPTQKPVELSARAIRNSSKRGDIVLDTFLGSSSVLIACDSLDRRCYGCELDPRYVDASVFRYIAYKGIDGVSEEVRKKYLEGVKNG
ncbi:MAG: DNA modification methylase [Candidatus Omnitrophica bacterium]|nr:DNA modification methylase [Candidatus Omnitrophota bacterium]